MHRAHISMPLQVVAQVVRVRTRPWRCCYADVVPPQHIVRDPKFFVSHT